MSRSIRMTTVDGYTFLFPAMTKAAPRQIAITVAITTGRTKKYIHPRTALATNATINVAMIGRNRAASVFANVPSCHSTTACTSCKTLMKLQTRSKNPNRSVKNPWRQNDWISLLRSPPTPPDLRQASTAFRRYDRQSKEK